MRGLTPPLFPSCELNRAALRSGRINEGELTVVGEGSRGRLGGVAHRSFFRSSVERR